MLEIGILMRRKNLLAILLALGFLPVHAQREAKTINDN